MKACSQSTVADVERAALFLERAREIRQGCKEQRREKRLKS